MVSLDTLEGLINNALWYHYDIGSDVLYLRLLAHRDTPALGEETDAGFILLRDQSADAPVGLTVIQGWKRFAHGDLPDSISEIQRHTEPWTLRLAA